MDKHEATTLLASKLAEYRRRTYEELVPLVERPVHSEAVGTSGARYQLEVSVHWDDRAGGNVRVIAAIDDGGWRSLSPVAQDFIKAPDGSFVGE